MSKKGKWRLTVRTEFAASHSLRNYDGKCEALHGHNFGVEVTVQGDKLDPDVEILMDFKSIKTELKQVLGIVDHTNLNDVAPFTTINPSSENLARFIFQTLQPRLDAYAVQLVSVTVSEKSAQSATYFEE